MFDVARHQVCVTRLFGSGLARKYRCQRRFTVDEALQGGLHLVEVFEAVHAFGAPAQLAGRLRSPKQEHAEDGDLAAGEVVNLLQTVLVFGYATVSSARWSGQPLGLQA